jgi:hypothetical protein
LWFRSQPRTVHIGRKRAGKRSKMETLRRLGYLKSVSHFMKTLCMRLVMGGVSQVGAHLFHPNKNKNATSGLWLTTLTNMRLVMDWALTSVLWYSPMRLQPGLVSKEARKELGIRRSRSMMMIYARIVSERTAAYSFMELSDMIIKVLATCITKKQRQRSRRQNRSRGWKMKAEKSRQILPKSLPKEPSQS